LRLFADDSNIFLHANYNIQDLYSDANKALTEISYWRSANKLNINVSKTNYSLYTLQSQKLVSSEKLMFKNIEIQRSTVIKYLGLYIDEQLTWKDHLNSIYLNLVKYTGIFYKIRAKIPSKKLKDLYYATVYPLIIYGIEVYANTNI